MSVRSWAQLLALAVLATAAGPSARAQTPSIERIAAGSAVERTVVGESSHFFEIEIAAGQVLDAVVEQVTADVVVRLRAPDGSLVEEVNAMPRSSGVETLWHLAQASGVFRIDVASAADWNRGRFALKVNAVRPPVDGERVPAEASSADAESDAHRAAGRAEEARRHRQVATGLHERGIALKVPVRRALLAGETDAYRLDLDADWVVHFLVEQHGVDVVVRLVDPAGQTVAEVDSPTGTSGAERLVAYPKLAGSYRLEVAPLEPGATGRYVLRTIALRRMTPKDHAIVEANRLSTEAAGLMQAFRSADAIPLIRRALEVYEEAYGKASRESRNTLHLLAYAHELLGEHAKSRDVRLESLAIAERVFDPMHPVIAEELNGLSNDYSSSGDSENALATALRARQIYEHHYGPDHPKVGATSITVGNGYLGTGDLKQAEAAFRRALELFEKAGGPETSDVALAVSNLGVVYKSMGRDDLAESFSKRALAIYEKAGLARCVAAAQLNMRIGCLLTGRGDGAAARAHLQQSVEVVESVFGPEHPGLVESLVHLAALEWGRGEVGAALATLGRVDKILDREVSAGVDAGSERQKTLVLGRHVRDADLYLSFALGAGARDPRASRLALAAALRGKGHALDVMADSVSALRRRGSVEDRVLLDRLAESRSEASRRIMDGPRGADLASHLAEVAKLDEQTEALERDVAARSVAFRSRTKSVTCDAVQAALPEGAALVEFVRFEPKDAMLLRTGPSRYGAIVLTTNGDPRVVDLGEAEKIDAAVATFRAAIRDPKRDAAAPARALDELAMRPVRAVLGDVRHLIVSPEGALNLVPFAALRDEAGKYLVERYTISYVTSGRDLLRLGDRVGGAGPALVIADPDFHAVPATDTTASDAPSTRGVDLANVTFRTLPGTREEARAIGRLVPGSVVLTRERATKAALEQAAAPWLLHVATHGFFIAGELAVSGEGAPARVENPLLRSGLALAGANRRDGGRGDGLMTALELSGLDLWGTQLTVLSACDTGVGDVRAGEGVYGLRRALVLTGSETQVLSLWDVDDQGTREMMTGYYRALLSGAGRADAMRAVQVRMLSSGRHAHPAYWAGFIVSGDWRPLRQR